MTTPASASENTAGQRVYVVEGMDMLSASECLRSLDKPGLTIWKLKGVALGVAESEHLQTLARNGKEYRAAMDALDAMPRDASEIGTAVHAAVEHHLNRDIAALSDLFTKCKLREDEIPNLAEIVRDHLKRFIEAQAEFHIRPYLVEQSVCNMEHGYAGTFDQASYLDDVNHLCELAHVCDVKSGKLYPEVAMQMAGYAYATHLIRFNHETQSNDIIGPNDGICKEVGYAISLHADVCQIIPVALRDAFYAFTAARDVSRWEEVKGTVLGTALKPAEALLPW